MNEKQMKRVSKLLENVGLDKKIGKTLTTIFTKSAPLYRRDTDILIGHQYIYELPEFTVSLQVDTKNVVQDMRVF
jgi:hypothetical protein